MVESQIECSFRLAHFELTEGWLSLRLCVVLDWRALKSWKGVCIEVFQTHCPSVATGRKLMRDEMEHNGHSQACRYHLELHLRYKNVQFYSRQINWY